MNPRIFIHGLNSSRRGYKARLMHQHFPDMRLPDFVGEPLERMKQLEKLLADQTGWDIVGSSLGGLMASLYALHNPDRVNRLILLAPALRRDYLPDPLPRPITVETIIYHGEHDDIIPIHEVDMIAGQLFTNCIFHRVDDDHLLHKTVQSLDWKGLLR